MGSHDQMTDAELLREAALDASAFGELHDRHAARLFTWARAPGTR